MEMVVMPDLPESDVGSALGCLWLEQWPAPGSSIHPLPYYFELHAASALLCFYIQPVVLASEAPHSFTSSTYTFTWLRRHPSTM